MYNLADYTNKLQYTWQCNNLHSHIDYIWAHDSIIPYLIDFTLQEPLTSTQSDHLILISSWAFPLALSSKLRHKTQCKHRVFNYKAMSHDIGKNFLLLPKTKFYPLIPT